MVMKHPYIFLEADLAVINKIDLARAMEVSPQGLAKDIHKINPAVKVVQVSCIRSEGVEKIIEALPINGRAKGN